MAYGTNTSGNAGQVAIDRFAEMMIARMEQMKASDWKKGWIGGVSGFAGLPQNVGGRNYSGSNSFFLQLQTAAQGYRLPVYLTFKQAHNLKAHVLKGEKAFPVVYWDVLVKDKNGHKVSGREKRQVPLKLLDGELSGSLPQFVPNWVFRKVLCPHTCLILPGVRSVRRHEKTVFPTKKL